MKIKFKDKLSDKSKFILLILLVSIIRIILTNKSSLYFFNSEYDDYLVLARAQQIVNGNWLGQYNYLTLVKGIGFELFLILFNFLKISFLSAQSIMYTLACIYFLYAIRNLVKSKKTLFIIYLLMLFNPVSLGYDTFQRVYRYSIIPFQVIFIFSSYYLLYENIVNMKGKILPHILIATIFLTWFRLTIETYIWIIPFILVVTVLLIINMIKNKKHIIFNILLALLPILAMFGAVEGVKCINNKVYGMYVYNDILETNFSDALKAIYSVDVHDDIDYVSVSQKKLEKLYEISPSLNKISEDLYFSIEGWKEYDQIRNDEIEDGWFYWALKQTVFDSGYNTPQKANEFYGNVAKEINLAIEENKVDSKPVMLSPLMSPFKIEYIPKMFLTIGTTFLYVMSFWENDLIIVENKMHIDEEFFVISKCIDNLNFITYTILELIVFAYIFVSLFVYMYGFYSYYKLCKKYLFEHDSSCKNTWLLVTACLLTTFIIIVGVSYTHISAFYSFKPSYFAGCYPLMWIFALLNIAFYKENIKVGEENENN